MPRRSKRLAPAAAGKNLELVKKEEEDTEKTMADLPPEVVTIVLDHLTRIETTKNILGCRLVNSQWFDIISPLVEQRIISGNSPVFPRLKIYFVNKRQDLLYVFQSPTMFPVGRNPFPFNSLSLDGETNLNYLPKSVADIQRMELPNFMSRFGGYLTTLEIQDLIFPGVYSVLNLLRCLTSLKTFRVQHVRLLDRIIKADIGLPILPPLPNLTTVVVKSHSNFRKPNKYEPEEVDGKSNVFYIWLITSYANHLLNLDLDTLKQLPALQGRLSYVYDFPDYKFLFIEKPTESAFQKLKKLKIYRPSHDFLCLSELPKLEQLTVTNRILDFDNFVDLIGFISKCQDSMKKLRLEVDWKTPMADEARLRVKLEDLVPNTKLKTLEINYSTTQDPSDEAMMMMIFLSMFPALETLHFFRFPSHCIATARELETINRVVRSENLGDQIAAVKIQLASLDQELFERSSNFYRQLAAIRFEVHNLEERKNELEANRFNAANLLDELEGGHLDFRNPQAREARLAAVRLAIEIGASRFKIIDLKKHEDELEQELCGIQTAAKKNRAQILKRLAALGVKKQDVVVEQFLVRQEIWNSFANLKLVSVNSGGKPDGDICLVQRPDEV